MIVYNRKRRWLTSLARMSRVSKRSGIRMGCQRERQIAQMPVTPHLLLLVPDCE